MINYKGEKIVVSTIPIGFSSQCLRDKDGNPATKVEFTVEDNELRYKMDGTNPTVSEGILACAECKIIIEGESNIQKFRAIAFVGRPAVINPLFFREF